MGYSQEGSVFLSQKTRSSEQFLSLESTRKVQCFDISKITPSLPISSSQPQQMHMKICLLQHFQLPPAPYLTDAPLLQELLDRSPLFLLPSPFQVKLGFIMKYHNISAFSTSGPSGRHCSFSFYPYFLYRNRTEEAVLISPFNRATEATTGFWPKVVEAGCKRILWVEKSGSISFRVRRKKQ